MNVTHDLARFVVDTHFNKLPENVTAQAKVCILDWLGATLAGSQEPPAQIVTSIIAERQGRKESTVIGTPIKTACTNAALVNGIMGHTVELDDVHEQSIIHPAAPILPAALAVAESHRASGKDLITAVVVGYEVAIRLGMTMNPSHYQYWHPTGTCGTFGATVAVSKLLGLNQEQITHALGIAGTQAAGLINVFGTMSKPLNAGRAALSGVWAGLLAKRGFTSSRRVLEAENGYYNATSQEPAMNRVIENLGQTFEILNTVFKRHAACGHSHGAIDALLELTTQHGVTPDAIEEIVVGTYPIAVKVVGTHCQPSTEAEAKFNLPYCLAAALVYDQVGLAQFSEDALQDPTIRELASKVHVNVASEFIDARLGCAQVTIRTVDGQELSHRVDVPRGYPQNPLKTVELEDKFRSLASRVLSRRRVETIIRKLIKLDTLNTLQPVTALLQRRGA